MAHGHGERVRFIRVEIKRTDEGLLVATSSSVPGLLVIAKSESELGEDIPAAIRVLWKERFGETVRVVPATLDDDQEVATLEAWAAVPAAIAAAELAY